MLDNKRRVIGTGCTPAQPVPKQETLGRFSVEAEYVQECGRPVSFTG